MLVRALGAFHACGIIHKDMKPEHILVRDSLEDVVIIDFGIATRLPAERQSTVAPALLAGTLAYMSPEQTGRMNRGIDYRTDYYGLGVVLYEMMTGALPFYASDPIEMIHAHIALTPAPPADKSPYIPRALSDIIMKLMAKDAEDRYQSAEGIHADLMTCLEEWQAKERIAGFPLGRRDIAHLLVTGAYRDNEVGAGHPLARTVEEIAASSARVSRIQLGSLAVDALSDMIADTLRCPRSAVMPLSTLVQHKTGEIPFFVGQFLKILQEGGVFSYSRDEQRWHFDLNRANALQPPDDVVDFDLARLASVCERSAAAVAAALWPALCEGFIERAGRARSRSWRAASIWHRITRPMPWRPGSRPSPCWTFPWQTE